MIHTGTLADAAHRKTPYFIEGRLLSHKSVLIGPEAPDDEGPNAFLIEQQPHMVLPPHFHGYGQFQIVVAGSGMLGTHLLSPLMIHYAGQRTPYGPIRPGPQGLSYMTVRPRTERGSAYFMPQSRHLRDPQVIPRYEKYSECTGIAGNMQPIAFTQTVTEELLPLMPNGLAAWLIRIPAKTQGESPALSGGGGRFHIVVGGSVAKEETELTWLSTIWADPDEMPQVLQAGPNGAEVLVLQFPHDACQHPLPVGPWSATPRDLSDAIQGQAGA